MHNSCARTQPGGSDQPVDRSLLWKETGVGDRGDDEEPGGTTLSSPPTVTVGLGLVPGRDSLPEPPREVKRTARVLEATKWPASLGPGSFQG